MRTRIINEKARKRPGEEHEALPKPKRQRVSVEIDLETVAEIEGKYNGLTDTKHKSALFTYVFTENFPFLSWKDKLIEKGIATFIACLEIFNRKVSKKQIIRAFSNQARTTSSIHAAQVKSLDFRVMQLLQNTEPDTRNAFMQRVNESDVELASEIRTLLKTTRIDNLLIKFQNQLITPQNTGLDYYHHIFKDNFTAKDFLTELLGKGKQGIHMLLACTNKITIVRYRLEFLQIMFRNDANWYKFFNDAESKNIFLEYLNEHVKISSYAHVVSAYNGIIKLIKGYAHVNTIESLYVQKQAEKERNLTKPPAEMIEEMQSDHSERNHLTFFKTRPAVVETPKVIDPTLYELTESERNDLENIHYFFSVYNKDKSILEEKCDVEMLLL